MDLSRCVRNTPFTVMTTPNACDLMANYDVPISQRNERDK